MTCVFGGQPALDPEHEREECERLSYPVTPWYGTANNFRCPVGQQAGAGILLLARGSLNALNKENLHSLTFEANSDRVTLKSLLLVRAFQTTPGARDDPSAGYWCEIVDKRHLARATGIDKSYNIRSSPGGSFFSASRNGGSDWTWVTMTTDVWNAVGKLGTFPGLPFTPNGTPEGFSFFGTYAYDALGIVLDRIGCALKLDPTTDTFSIVRLSVEDLLSDQDLAREDAVLIWETGPVEPNRGRVPQKVRILFPRQRVAPDTTGGSPWEVRDVSDAATGGALPGVESNTFAILYDDLPAIFDSGGSLTNGTDLTNRAAERAADYFRKARLSRINRGFTGALSGRGQLPGARIKVIEWTEHGGGQGLFQGVKTEIARFPGLPAFLPGSNGGGMGGGRLTTINNEQSIFSSYSLLNSYTAFMQGGPTNNYFSGPQIQFMQQLLLQFLSTYDFTFGGSVTFTGTVTGAGSTKDWHYWRNVGTGGGAGTCWYAVSSMNNSDATSQTFTGATMYAAPFLTPKAVTVDRIAIRVLTANAGSNARLGIYSAASETNLYPSARVIDAGEIDAGATGWKELTISQALAAGTLYFLAVLIEDSSAAYMAMRTNDIVPVFGYPNQPNTADPKRAAVSVGQAYGALPATFPAGGGILDAIDTTFFPLVFVRLSA